MSVYKGENVIAGGSVDTYFVRKPAWSQAVAISVTDLVAGYTAPSDGFLIGYMTSAGTPALELAINGVIVGKGSYSANSYVAWTTMPLPMNKGDTITKIAGNINATAGLYNVSFVPFEDSTVAEPEVVTPEYIRNQNILSDWEDVTFTNGQYTALYDGVIAFDNSRWTSTNNLGYVSVNGVGCANFGQIDGGTVVEAHLASMSVSVKKGDIVETGSYTGVWTTKARYYKLRDYTGR